MTWRVQVLGQPPRRSAPKGKAKSVPKAAPKSDAAAKAKVKVLPQKRPAPGPGPEEASGGSSANSVPAPAGPVEPSRAPVVMRRPSALRRPAASAVTMPDSSESAQPEAREGMQG